MATRKDAHLTIRISPEELEQIKEFAIENGMQQSEFVLSAIRSSMGKQGVQEQYLLLAARIAALEMRLVSENAA